MKKYALLLCLTLTGCTGGKTILPVTAADIQDRSLILGAQQAVQRGQYQEAEQLLSKYVYRTDKGDLKIQFWGLNGEQENRHRHCDFSPLGNREGPDAGSVRKRIPFGRRVQGHYVPTLGTAGALSGGVCLLEQPRP